LNEGEKEIMLLIIVLAFLLSSILKPQIVDYPYGIGKLSYLTRAYPKNIIGEFERFTPSRVKQFFRFYITEIVFQRNPAGI